MLSTKFKSRVSNKIRVLSVMSASMLLSSNVAPQIALARGTEIGIPPKATPANVKKGARSVTLIKPKLSFSTAPSDLELSTARVFPLPLTPLQGTESSGENKALAEALIAFKAQSDAENLDLLTNFLNRYPQSRWAPALRMNIAESLYESGLISTAMSNWKSAWLSTKDSVIPAEKAIADECITHLLVATARLGRTEDLEKYVPLVAKRNLDGANELRFKEAKHCLWAQKNLVQQTFTCGPFAINTILNIGKKNPVVHSTVCTLPSEKRGTNLAQVKDLSDKVGLHYQMAMRSPGAKLILPCVMHWKLGHFSAITDQNDQRYHITDPTFDSNSNLWLKMSAIEAESDGYFLVPNGPLPPGWKSVSREEAMNIWGRSFIGANSTNKGGCDPTTRCGCDHSQCRGTPTAGSGGASGMAKPSAFMLQATLKIQDTPIHYSTPVGPQIQFLINYNHQEDMQPTTWSFTNLGANWSMNWCAYLTLDNSKNATVRMPGGGYELFNYAVPDNIQNPYKPDLMSQAVLTVPTAGVYQRQLPDGSVQVFNQPDLAGHIFMTQIIDAQGNSAYIQYDSNFRVVSITDAIGEASTISYLSNTVGNAGFYKVSQITDPFGRSALFGYDSTSTYLTSITDTAGITSQFGYDPNLTTSFINRLTTPYGTTSFVQNQWTNIGVTEEFTTLQTYFPDGTSEVILNACGTSTFTQYWDREKFALYPTEYLSPFGNVHARLIQWMVTPVNPFSPVPAMDADLPSGNFNTAIVALYSYQGEGIAPDNFFPTIGSIGLPTSVSRTPNFSQPQVYKYQYNALGKTTQSVDPAGRTFSYLYAANGIDLMEARQTKNGANDFIGKWFYNNNQHLPNKYVDSSGQVTQFTYNSFGQPTSTTDALGNVSSNVYNSTGLLTQVNGPLPGNADVTTFQYDGYNRLYSATDSEGYTTYFSYDSADRPIQTLYPDGSTEQKFYSNLDVVMEKDRLGRATQRAFDTMDQLAYEIDPLGRKTEYTWCTCGSLGAITDANGNTTNFQHNPLGWLTKKTYPDGSNNQFAYDQLGRLITRTDALGQQTSYSYNLDDTLSNVSYSFTINPTPSVTYTWDANYNRLTEVKNTNSGNTVSDYVYTYNPYITNPFGTPTTGAGMLATVTNKVIPNSTVSYSYDALGRTTNRQINGAANSVTWTYDAISRLTSEANALGTFTYKYVDDVTGSSRGTSRLASIGYPNGQTTNFSWYPTNQDERLQGITNLDTSGHTRSQFNYAYDSVGQIIRWSQQNAGLTPINYALGYDAAGQLSSAQAGFGSPTNSTASQYFYGYDPAANRVAAQQSTIQTAVIGGTVTSGNTLTITVQDAGLPNGQEAVNYVVQTGDTLSTVASKLAAAISADPALQTFGVNASASSNLIKIRSCSTGVTTYSQSTSTGATETVTLGVSTNAVQNASIGLLGPGYQSTQSDVLSLTVYDSGLSGGATTVSYTVPSSGTSLSTIATGLASVVNTNSNLSTLGVTASSASSVVSLKSASPNITTYKSSVTPTTGGGSETISFGTNLVGNISATVGGSATTGDAISLTVRAIQLSGGQESVVYKVPSGSNLSTVASGLASAVNADSALSTFGASATSSGAVVSISTSPTYSKSTSGGATETITLGTNTNGNISATIGGTVTTGNTLTITTNGAGLSAAQNATYTVVGVDTLTSIAAGLASRINALTALQGIHVHATSAGAVVNVTYLPVNYPAYLTAVTSGATETITTFMNPNGNQNIVLSGSKTTGDAVKLTVFDSGLSGGQETASYTVLAGDTLTTIATGLKSAMNSDANLQAIGVSATSSGTTLTVSSLSPNVTSYLPSVSASATETLVLGTNPNGSQTLVVNGTTITNGDVLKISTYNSALTGGVETVSYTVATGNTLANIASGLASAVNGDSNLSGIGVTAAAVSNVVNLKSTSTNATTYVSSANATATETVVVGPSTGAVEEICNSLNQLVGRRPGGSVLFQADTNKPIKSAAASLTTPVISLSFIGNRGSNPYPVYLASTNSGATENVVSSADINGNGRVMLSGTPTSGNTITITTKYSPLSGGQEIVTYTVGSSDTLSSIASSLSGLVNADANLKSAGIASGVVGTKSGTISSSEGFTVSPDLGAGVNGVQVSAVDGGNNTTSNTHQIEIPASTSYKGTTSGGATETLTFSTGANGSSTLTVGGTVTTTNPNTPNTSSPVFSQGSVPASYKVQSGDTLATIAAGLTTSVNNLLAGPLASSSGAVITINCMAGPTLQYDANGNMLSDGLNAYQWDAENRLIQINYPGSSNYSQFLYDSIGENVKLLEYSGGALQSTTQFVWADSSRSEARNSSGAVTAQYFGQGETLSGTRYYWITDHLKSIREMSNTSGQIVAQYQYDPYGQALKIQGAVSSDFQYAGYYMHSRSGLCMPQHRSYSATLARWISEDPLGDSSFYQFVNDEPISSTDSTGLCMDDFEWRNTTIALANDAIDAVNKFNFDNRTAGIFGFRIPPGSTAEGTAIHKNFFNFCLKDKRIRGKGHCTDHPPEPGPDAYEALPCLPPCAYWWELTTEGEISRHNDRINAQGFLLRNGLYIIYKNVKGKPQDQPHIDELPPDVSPGLRPRREYF